MPPVTMCNNDEAGRASAAQQHGCLRRIKLEWQEVMSEIDRPLFTNVDSMDVVTLTLIKIPRMLKLF